MGALQEELSDDSQLIEFKADNAWASSRYVLTPMIKSCNNWCNLFSTALDDLVGLVSPRRIVYCEGRAEPNSRGEEQGLDAIVYNTIFGEKYPDTLFISSGGNTELDQRREVPASSFPYGIRTQRLCRYRRAPTTYLLSEGNEDWGT